MKRALLAVTLLACSAAAYGQRLDPLAPLKTYAAKALPRCPGSSLTFEALPPGPSNFNVYGVTLRSSDQYCGSQKYMLYSPKTQQILLGSIIPLTSDDRPATVRIAETASKALNKQVTATIAPFPLPDGIKAVSVLRQTPFGPFSYAAFIDASEQYLIVGSRGNLTKDPATSLREALGTQNAVRRGNAKSKVEILEISDFQCPTCAAAHKKVEPLIAKNLAKMNYMRLDLPLFEHHEWAVPAAMGARAIQRVAPAKYWEYVDYVFKNQEEISKRNFDEVIKDYAEDHDIDWSALQKIYASKSERQALLDQVSRAFAIGVASTPTFVINGQIMGFGPEGSFTIEAIRKAIGLPAESAAKSTGK